ncbi:MAG: VanZ family protein [Halanaeroarchaeum sp.]
MTVRRESARTVALLFGVALTVGTLAPAGAGGGAPALAVGPIGLDKLLHAGGFLVLTVLVARAAPGGKIGFGLVIALVAYGGGLELAQSFVPGRTPDVLDFLANVIGVVVGLLVARWVER